MIEWLDSAYPPNAAQVAAAKAAGYGGWAGYFPGPNILHGWAKADFDRVKAGGLKTLAYCSGGADPAAMGAQSRSWLVPICLDDEAGIRPHGSWVQPWLDSATNAGALAGAGQYGNYWVHAGIRAAFHILAAYPTGGDPASVDWWSLTARPAGLTGWQWVGSHQLFGITVDAAWFDDGIGASAFGMVGGEMTPDDLNLVHDALQFKAWGIVDTSAQSRNSFVYAVQHGTSIGSILAGWMQNPQAAKWAAELKIVGQPAAAQSGLSADQAKQLAAVESLVGIANALKSELDVVKAEVDAVVAKTSKDLA